MSKKEGFQILDTQNAATAGGNVGDKGARQLPQTGGRRKLSDISNLSQNQRLLIGGNKPQFIDPTVRAFIDRLQGENMVLVKMLAQRDKIIEQIGLEFNSLNATFVKMQEQNQQLAIANAQMLVELNSGKERFKVLENELGWKNDLLKARKTENKSKRPCNNADAEENDESLKEGGDDEKHCKTNQSVQADISDTSHRLQSVQKIENRRRSTRRQSTIDKFAELKHADNSIEIDDTQVPSCPLPDHSPSEKESHSKNDASVKNEGNNNSASEQGYESQEPSRSLRCRPTREATRKVTSYKERPVNIKMRRSE